MLYQNKLSRNQGNRVYVITALLSLMVLCNVTVVAQTIPAKHKLPSQTKIMNGSDPDKSYMIFKADSNEEIDNIESKINADGGTITVSNIKRNEKGFITSISLKYTVDDKSMVQGVYVDEDLNSIFFGTTVDGGVFLGKSDNTGKWLENKEPLIYIDGKKASKTEMDNIHPQKIAAMNVWKGKKAVEKYGQEAVDGAIEVTTKSE